MTSVVGETAYCSLFKGMVAADIGSRALPIVAIVLVNLFLTPLVRWLTHFERHRSRSRAACVEAWALFVAGFLNSAISVLVANTFVLGLRSLLDKTWIGSWIMLGIYSDLSPGWYTDVGRTLMLSQLLTCAARILRLGFSIMRVKGRRRDAWMSLTQRELNEALTGPEVRELSSSSDLLSFMCVLSPSLPLLIPSSLLRTSMGSTWRWCL
jgi:hypothetical protein